LKIRSHGCEAIEGEVAESRASPVLKIRSHGFEAIEGEVAENIASTELKIRSHGSEAIEGEVAEGRASPQLEIRSRGFEAIEGSARLEHIEVKGGAFVVASRPPEPDGGDEGEGLGLCLVETAAEVYYIGDAECSGGGHEASIGEIAGADVHGMVKCAATAELRDKVAAALERVGTKTARQRHDPYVLLEKARIVEYADELIGVVVRELYAAELRAIQTDEAATGSEGDIVAASGGSGSGSKPRRRRRPG
jgi:hypothetical protein